MHVCYCAEGHAESVPHLPLSPRVHQCSPLLVSLLTLCSNVVPSFQTDSTEPIDLRDMPPAVAEVYVLTVLSTMQRQSGARRVISQNLVFLVPPYEGTKVGRSWLLG